MWFLNFFKLVIWIYTKLFKCIIFTVYRERNEQKVLQNNRFTSFNQNYFTTPISKTFELPRIEKPNYRHDFTPSNILPLSSKEFVDSSDLLPVTKQVEEDALSNFSQETDGSSTLYLQKDELDTLNDIIAQPLSLVAQQRLAGQHGPIEAKRFIYSVN